MKILITGGSGFIGRRLALNLISHGHEVYLLVRAKSIKSAIQLFANTPVKFIEGDIEESEVINPEQLNEIQKIDSFIHLAAVYDLKVSPEESYKANVLGTQNILRLIKKMKGLKFFHYFSTYAVNPTLKGLILEDELSDEKNQFNDFYSKAKNLAEHIVRSESFSGVKVIIHRPGIIIGDSNSGLMDKIDGPYYFFDFIMRLKSLAIAKYLPLLPLPVPKTSRLNVLPVDILVEWSSEIIRNPKQHDLRCYHLVPYEQIGTLIFLKRSLELMELSLKILPVSAPGLFSLIFPFLGIPKETIFYLQQKASFDQSHLREDYPGLMDKPYQEYLPNIIQAYRKRIR